MNRNLTKTVIITGITTNNPIFQWYKIGQKFNVVKSVVKSLLTDNDYYRVVNNEGKIDEYIHFSDCKEITEWRNSKLEQLGI